MRIFKKAAVSMTAVGLLAFGAVVGVGGSAFAGQGPEGLITGCESQVGSVVPGLEPNCVALGGSTDNPTSIAIYVDTEGLGALIDAQPGQGLDAAWTLSCVVNGTTVNVPGTYDITSTSQASYTTINLQTAVGSPEPNQCEIEYMTVETALPLGGGKLTRDAVNVASFVVGVAALSATASPGAIYQDEGTTPAGAHAGLCADDTANGNAGSKIQSFQCLSDLADAFVRTSTGQLVHNGDCVGLSGSNVVLATCIANDAAQQWAQSTVGGTIMNRLTSTCLTASSVKDGTQLTVNACGSGTDQKWNLPAVSAVPIQPAAPAWGAARYQR